MAPSEFEDITPHVVITFEDGLPFGYQRSVLRADPDRVDATLAEIEAIVQRPESRLRTLQFEHRPDKAAGFIELAGSGEPDAKAVRDMLRAEGLAAAVDLEPAYFADDPYPARQFGGLPAKEGHGTMRAGILLVGLAPPPRSETVPDAGRRPVVAVLDTPVREHPWLGEGSGVDSFWRDAREVEDAWRPHFAVPEETANGRLSHAGHGTFIAGLVRLLAPDARVLSVPVMHGNGVVEEGHVLHALGWLRDRVSKAVAEGRPELFVDVVNLSFGRYELEGRDPAITAPLREVLDELARRGVRVVASAGNRPVEKHVFPAAFDGLLSVGALDPDGTTAAYTSTGEWVSVEAPGTSVVSALPKFDRAKWPLPDDLDDNGLPIGSDPNFQSSLVGQWSGTSFAAGWVSASIAAKLLEQATPGGLAEVSPEAAGARATSAFEAVEADLERWVVSHGVVE
jgi:hypothetical protein